ncbi:hypothetical protein PGT21_003809 [Puccinia graminis f. sp. tritici]|uniref:Uncharacterized protein n=1 Tax=Puccinia graminis f. sp. tritici TaxID=56615 RepID=A0A5B0P5Z4_PUCGR|nr:hypothetical protein PGT21_003809 [Puccinia graminis f. sp. tritici]
MNLDLSAEKTGKEAARSDRNLTTHMEWFGRGTPIPFRLNSQWKDISINATLVPESERSSELIPSGPTQLLRMSEVSFVLSSSWAPRTLREKIESENFSSHASQLSLNGDHNSHMIVAEFEIGKIRGQMPIDNLLIMHMLSQSHPSGSSKLKAAPPSNSQNNHSPRNNRREDTPKFVFGLSIQSMSYDFYGPPCPPTTPSSSSLGPTFNPINNIGNSSRGKRIIDWMLVFPL